MNILNTDNPINFANQIAVVLDLKPHERQMLLEEINLKVKLKKKLILSTVKLRFLKLNIAFLQRHKRIDQGIKESILREK